MPDVQDVGIDDLTDYFLFVIGPAAHCKMSGLKSGIADINHLNWRHRLGNRIQYRTTQSLASARNLGVVGRPARATAEDDTIFVRNDGLGVALTAINPKEEPRFVLHSSHLSSASANRSHNRSISTPSLAAKSCRK